MFHVLLSLHVSFWSNIRFSILKAYRFSHNFYICFLSFCVCILRSAKKECEATLFWFLAFVPIKKIAGLQVD